FQILSYLYFHILAKTMKVNKKQLAEIFGRDVRTITTWQSQGLPMISGGGNLTARLHEPLPAGAVMHIVPRLAGAKSGWAGVLLGARWLERHLFPV
ncbi:hypothetical protein F3U65_23630, partial [Salmonella enterica]|nr:hypothetical protein [Salmonella enterica]EDR8730817.1 hypothetical protein [Salmonella enterica]EEL5142216.1 hypothetical protein [Salmonella enterica]EEO4240913.1 hypothetical protein [Salmonella enterica]